MLLRILSRRAIKYRLTVCSKLLPNFNSWLNYESGQGRTRLRRSRRRSGSRFKNGHRSPKQYELIGSKTMLERSVQVLLDEPRIKELVVVISPADIIGQRLVFEDPRVRIARVGGQTRADSVKNGILFSNLKSSDWVLVHDAARPCLLTSDVTKLMDYCQRHQESAILAVRSMTLLKRRRKRHNRLHRESRRFVGCSDPAVFPSRRINPRHE